MDNTEGALFTPEQRAFIRQAVGHLAGRDGSIELRYKRGELHAIHYKLPGLVASMEDAMDRIICAGGYGKIVLEPVRDDEGKVHLRMFVEVSREFPLSRKR